MCGAVVGLPAISGLIASDNIGNCLEPAHGSPPMAIDLLKYYLKRLDETLPELRNQDNHCKYQLADRYRSRNLKVDGSNRHNIRVSFASGLNLHAIVLAMGELN